MIVIASNSALRSLASGQQATFKVAESEANLGNKKMKHWLRVKASLRSIKLRLKCQVKHSQTKCIKMQLTPEVSCP